jgi:hypothetical protein
MAHRFTLSRIPTYCQSPTASPPEHKALLIGINYASSVDDNDQGYRELKGPINDAKEIKKALIGGVSAVSLPHRAQRDYYSQSSLSTRKRIFA